MLRVPVERLPDGRKPHKTMWLWHAGPAPLSLDELWRAYLARFDEEHAFKFAKGTLGLTAARVRTPEQADRWVRLVMAAFAQLLLARPLAADLRRPWETRPPPAAPCPQAGSAAGLQTSAPAWAPPPVSLNPPGPAPDGPKAPPKAPDVCLNAPVWARESPTVRTYFAEITPVYDNAQSMTDVICLQLKTLAIQCKSHVVLAGESLCGVAAVVTAKASRVAMTQQVLSTLPMMASEREDSDTGTSRCPASPDTAAARSPSATGADVLSTCSVGSGVVSARELVVLGTASQAPTRPRNHNGYLLRWDGEGLLFDPGEGTQRQMLFAGVTASQITRICVTHFHGDHCLGLPGVLGTMSLDRVPHLVEACYPAECQEVFDRLRHAALVP